MNISDMQFMVAAGQIRLTEMQLNAQISRLRDSGLWLGADADRFFQEWDSDVRARLLGAALKLEALAVVPFL